MENHGWNQHFDVDLLDAEGPDLELAIAGGKVIQKNYVGKNLADYDSMLVLSHFKATSHGRIWRRHQAAFYRHRVVLRQKPISTELVSREDIWTADHDLFLESMADAAKSVIEYFDGNIVYINVMKNMSVDCDCCAVAEDPCMKDIGILASTDPIAIDQACIDLVYASEDPGRDHLLERIESRNGVHTIEAAAALGYGTREYELITVE